jgi:hypothetical protein
MSPTAGLRGGGSGQKSRFDRLAITSAPPSVPSVEPSGGLCRQVGNIVTGISSVACTATDKTGKKYEVQFETDGSPITLRRIRRTPLTTEKTPCDAKPAARMPQPGRRRRRAEGSDGLHDRVPGRS